MPASGRVEQIGAANESTGADYIHGRACREHAGVRESDHAADLASMTAQCPCPVNHQGLTGEGVDCRRGIAWSKGGFAGNKPDGHPAFVVGEAWADDDAGEVVEGEFVSHLRMVPRPAKLRHHLRSCSNVRLRVLNQCLNCAATVFTLCCAGAAGC